MCDFQQPQAPWSNVSTRVWICWICFQRARLYHIYGA